LSRCALAISPICNLGLLREDFLHWAALKVTLRGRSMR
jgi:hypothetical protein